MTAGCRLDRARQPIQRPIRAKPEVEPATPAHRRMHIAIDVNEGDVDLGGAAVDRENALNRKHL